jgi:hypothetical protein
MVIHTSSNVPSRRGIISNPINTLDDISVNVSRTIADTSNFFRYERSALICGANEWRWE